MTRALIPLLAALLLAPQSAPRPLHERAELQWWRESMRTRDERLAWWREARFGMFIHWGVYSLPAGIWEGTPVSGYAEHIQRIRKIPIAVYRERVAGQFNPVRFNADDWVLAAKRAGMGYLIITAKHHDGFAMYDSAVSDYTIMKATPWGKIGRDPMRELKDACVKHGLRFGFYYSHAFDWGEANAAGNDWDYQNPGGDRLLHGANWWEKAPELLPRIRRYVDEKAIPQVRELIHKYDPDILWFDTPHKLPVEENLRIVRAAREAKPRIVINGRAVQPVPGGPPARFGDYMSTADRPVEFLDHEGDWEGIPTTNESYGHHQADSSHKPPEHFVRLLANAAARGGNLLLNIGPMGDGAIDPKDLAILEGIGKWMAAYGESIRGSERTPLPIQSWGHSTRRGSRLYLHVFDWPADGRLYLAGMRSEVTTARVLSTANTQPLAISRVNRDDIEIQIPTTAPHPWNSVIVIDAAGISANPARHIPAFSTTTLHVFHGKLSGPGVRLGDGKRLRDATLGWNDVNSGVDWNVRLTKAGRFRVSVNYATAAKDAAGAYEIRFGERVVRGEVAPTERDNAFRSVDVGEIQLDAGEFSVKIRPLTLAGPELMRLRAIVVTPIASRTAYSDLTAPLRQWLATHGITEPTFERFARGVEQRTRERVEEGEREALIYYVLQSSSFTALPAIEPALSAKQFVETEPPAIPHEVSRRFDAFIAALNRPPSDERFGHFAAVLPETSGAQTFLRTGYESAMRFLHEKEFTTPKARVPLLYQQRAASTDTSVEANYPVDLAVRLIRELAPATRLNRTLVVGPGLDLAPRTGLMDSVPPQSIQPFAVADSLLGNALADATALRVQCVDVNDAVVRHLSRAAAGKITKLFVRPGLIDGASHRFTEEYRRYLLRFGREIGNRSTEAALLLHPHITRAISAERLNIITERYPAASYDVVIATNVFPYFTDAELALALGNIASMLRPGGYLIHNEIRDALPPLAAASGLNPLQVRGLVLASGALGSIADSISIYSNTASSHR